MSPNVKTGALSPSYIEVMARASICPVCKKILGPAQTIYTIDEQDYHPECYEKREAEPPKSEPDPDRG